MTNEQERLPRAVELAANIVAGHVRRTETSPDAFAGLLLNAFRAITDIERASRDPSFLDRLISASSIPSGALASGSSGSAPAESVMESTVSMTTEPTVSAESRAYVGMVPPPEEDRASGYVRNGLRTVQHGSLLCLDDGQEVTFLGRHLRKLGTTESDYRLRWALPDDYPMTSPAYVEQKKAAARRSGFGTSVRPDRENRAAGQGGADSAPAPARSKAERRSGTLALAY